MVPDEILLKPATLTDEEMDRMKRHPADGANTLSNVPTATDAIPVIRHHHERFDGAGYPDGLSGEEIPIGARILLVAFDAMTEDRPYRKAMPVAEAIDELNRYSGTQFDPAVVEAFLAVLKRPDAIRRTRPTATPRLCPPLSERRPIPTRAAETARIAVTRTLSRQAIPSRRRPASPWSPRRPPLNAPTLSTPGGALRSCP